MANLNVQVISKRDRFEAVVDVVGLNPTKLQKRSDGTTEFETRSALITAAKNIAKRLGYPNVRIIESGVSVVKKAVKSVPPTSNKIKNNKKKLAACW